MAERAAEPLWWQRGVIYQIYPRSFQDSSGDGIGDLPGIIRRVPYLADTLGIDAVWLSPFYPSPMADFGYDVSNYTAVHPLFGTLADFDRLVATLHEREIRLIVDFVPNHSSEQHPWFLASRSSRDNPKRDWYVWADAAADGGPPNNWLSVFGGSAWEWDERTHQYYLHSFLEQQPDLNWRNPEVKAAMFDAMRFWLDRGVDGFRIDVAHFIMKDPLLRDNPPNPANDKTSYKPMGDYDSELHLYDKGHPDVHGVFREMRDLLDSYSIQRPRMCVGEIHEFDMPTWASYYGGGLDELHMPFNFSLLGIEWEATAVRQVVDKIEANTPAGAWPNYVLGNHDEHRIATRVGPAQARVALMFLLTVRGTPTMYYGDEIGMHDVSIPPDRMQDPWGKRVHGFGLGRDPERTPMQWDNGPNAGFCEAEVEPWLPIAEDYPEINVAREQKEPCSILTLTRRLLALRRSSPALQQGTYRPVESTQEIFLYVREHQDESVLVALNFSDQEQEVRYEGSAARVLLSTYLDADVPVQGGAIHLRPNEGCVIELSAE